MRVVELDAAHWRTAQDFYDALLAALGAPEGHGHSVNALIDSMVYGGMNAVEPPYTVRIKNLKGAPKDILTEMGYLKESLPGQREWFRKLKGRDVEVYLDTELN